ncbi:MAG TPA: exosortase/archaeosortase family protein [Verrucomicrobiae bacterium]|nr:exosortase/archaeosortase family protein [Verrucomicrobiae bacterium]
MDEQPTTGILDEFQTELVDAWRRLPNKGFFFILLGIWLALFQFLGNSTFGYLDTPSLLKWMYILGSSRSGEGETDDNQMLIAPLIVLGLFWWKRKELLKQPMTLSWPGLLLVGLGLLLHIVGYRVQQPRISIIAMFTGIYGLMGLAWGPKFLRASLFPFFLFIFCVPFGTLSEFITVPLRHLVARIVEVMANAMPHFMHLGIIRQGTQLVDPDGHFQYEVAAACGGIRSLIVTIMLAIVFGFTVFRSAWKRIVLIALAFPLAVAGNVLRLVVVIMASKWVSKDFGMGVHNNTITSLLPYVPAVFALLWLGSLLEKKSAPTEVPQSTPTPTGQPTSGASAPATAQDQKVPA